MPKAIIGLTLTFHLCEALFVEHLTGQYEQGATIQTLLLLG